MKLCMGCMEQIEDHVSVCPHCGFDESKFKQESYYLNPGTIVGGKYIVGRVLNYSGYTISYMGMDAESNRKVIVREYLPSDFSTRSEGENEITIYSGDAKIQFERGLTNFLNESNRIQSLGKLEGIATVYDCIAENDTGYVISEYVKGRTLKEMLGRNNKISVEEAKRLIVQLLKGLAKLHPMDVVHCDISPETIVVSETGEVKLSDFGAIRYVTTANSKSLALLLKQGYAPEEQYRSKGTRGPWTDVYAAAAVMYRMITGVVPQESVERALVDELKTPSQLGVSIPENIENALMNALNVYKDDRTSSAGDFLKELNSPAVKRTKVTKKDNDTGKFPTWAKVLVACMLCLIVAGGAVLLIRSNHSGSGNLGSASQEYEIEDYREKSIKYEDLEKKIKNLSDKYGGGITILKEDAYDYDSEKNGSVKTCTVEPTGDLLADIKDGKYEELKYSNNKIEGTIYIYVYQDKTIKYSELKELNANTLAMKINAEGSSQDPLNSDSRFVESDGEQKNYFDIISIGLNDGTSIPFADIKKGSGEQDSIPVAEIKTVIYSAGEFFYWESIEDYTGEIVDEVQVDTYRRNGKKAKPEPANNKKALSESNLIDAEYCSFLKPKGYIWDQTVKEGLVDESKFEAGNYLFRIVGESVSWNRSMTGSELTEKLKNAGILNVKLSGTSNNMDLVKNCTVAEYENEALQIFRKDTVVTIETVKPVPQTQAPAPANPEKPQEKPQEKPDDSWAD